MIGSYDPEVMEFASFHDLLSDFLRLVDIEMAEEYRDRWRRGILKILYHAYRSPSGFAPMFSTGTHTI